MQSRARSARVWLLLGMPLALFLSFPLLALVSEARSFNLLHELSQPSAVQAVLLTLGTTVCSVLLCALFGTPLSFWLARTETRFARFLELLMELPIALPPAAAGVALLLAFGRHGHLGLNVSFTVFAVILAQVFVASPFFLKAATNAFRDQSREMFGVAETDGANEWERFWKLAVPIGWRSLMGGLAITWARAAGEFGATIIFAGNFPGRTETMPLAIYLGFERDLNQANALAIVLSGCAVVGLGLGKVLTSAAR